MKKLIMTMLVIFTAFSLIHAQRVGVPSGGIFSTPGGLLAHVQSNTASDLGNFSKQWIGIGQPLSGLYGFRVQSNNNAAILALTGTSSNKKCELIWSGPNKTANFEINQITNFTNGKINRFTIKTNGRVGIGFTAPETKLEVKGIVRATSQATRNNRTEIGHSGSDGFINTYGAGNLDFRHNATTLMSLKENGNVGIGRTNPYYKLDVNGSARITTLFVSSDKRFKKDIKGINNPLDKINALNGFTYRFNDRKIGEYDFSKTTQEKQLGFMAQDVQKVFPELVSADEDGYLSVNYIGLIPVLVEALKEQQEVAKEQKEEIADLQTRMAKLEALLNTSETIQGNLSTPTGNTVEGIVLRQNAPNPFNGSTTIEYQLPERLASATLIVSDLNGRTISTYTISGKGNVQFDANSLDSGIYTYAIIANGQSIAAQKMVIQK